jgi:hypothetical protein
MRRKCLCGGFTTVEKNQSLPFEPLRPQFKPAMLKALLVEAVRARTVCASGSSACCSPSLLYVPSSQLSRAFLRGRLRSTGGLADLVPGRLVILRSAGGRFE